MVRRCVRVRFQANPIGVHIITPLAYQPIGGRVQLVRKKTEERTSSSSTPKNVPSRLILICAIDATILIRKPGETPYLFVSTSLLALPENLHRQLSANDSLRIPAVKRPPFFPCRLEGKACFFAEGPSKI